MRPSLVLCYVFPLVPMRASRCVQGQENYEKSIDCFRRYLGLAKHGNDPLAEAQALDSLGNVYHSLANDCSLPVWRNMHWFECISVL